LQIDLRNKDSGHLVIHYGGALLSVDAYTFANSMVSLADSIREVNRIINPTLLIDVRIEALGPGSFRAVLKSIQSGASGIVKRQGEAAVISILITLLFQYWGGENHNVEISITGESYIIQTGNTKIILPLTVHEQLRNVQNSPAVQESIQKTFRVLNVDPAIENFGFAEEIDSLEPFLKIPKSDFSRLSEQQLFPESPAAERLRSERARLVVNKMYLRALDRKWSFEWNGTPLSALVKDENFRNRIKLRQVSLLSGDALDVEISFVQKYDEKLGLYVNDHLSYFIKKVFGKIDQSNGQVEMFN
jgi:hypothetical protein